MPLLRRWSNVTAVIRFTCFLLLSALPGFAQSPIPPMRVKAGPLHWVANVGHEVKQTGVDFVKWRYPMWNLMVLAEVGADLADAKTTADCQHHVPGCTEYNSSLYGKHPGFGRVAATDIGTSSILIVTSHWLHTHRPEPYFKTADYWWIAPQAIDIIGTSRAAYINAGFQEKPVSVQQNGSTIMLHGGLK